ncbi:GrpB family protein [candidate division TA06 bacterium]|uniref:GrpB family protein n=1 Tax=candidate division TA06 bacterium TaxID=2250710 RepID=A0A523UVH0_UNCT6|nr:MAG: GrpB family protein [candidate division TA06 bacterium]
MRVAIVDYDPAWPEQFRLEKEKLLAAIGSYVAEIQHIGSTAVPGLAGKPVIDVMVGVHPLSEADAVCIDAIIQLGYEYVSAFEKDTPFRRYFRKNNSNGVRTHQIHLVEIGSEWWLRHLAFRDYLRSHAEAREAYERVKRELASKEWEDVNDYAEAKTEFIRAIEEKAMTWWQEVKGRH